MALATIPGDDRSVAGAVERLVAAARRSPVAFQASAAAAVGAALALATTVVPPLFVLVGLLFVLTVPLLLRTPVPAVLLILLFFSTIFDVDSLPLVSVGIGSFNPLDIVLLSYLGLIVVRAGVEPGFKPPIGVAEAAIFLFLVILVLATMFGVANGTTELDEATNALRYFAYNAVFLVVAFLLPDRRSADRLVAGFLSLSALVSVAVIAQLVLGPSLLFVTGRVEEASQSGLDAQGVARIIPSGRYLLLVSFWTFSALLAMAERRLWLLRAGWILTGLGMLLTFNRNFWISTVVVVGLLLVLIGQQDRQRLVRYLWWSLAVGAVVVTGILAGPPSVARTSILSIGERTVSIFTPETYNASFAENGRYLSSLEFRRVENQYAYEQLQPPSLLGLGAGAAYRPTDERIDSEGFVFGQGYIHNGHLWVLLKSGLLGYGALMICFAAVLHRGLRSWRNQPTPESRAVVLAFSVALIGIVLSSIVDPILADVTWTPVFGTMAGVAAFYVRTAKPAGGDEGRVPAGTDSELERVGP